MLCTYNGNSQDDCGSLAARRIFEENKKGLFCRVCQNRFDVADAKDYCHNSDQSKNAIEPKRYQE